MLTWFLNPTLNDQNLILKMEGAPMAGHQMAVIKILSASVLGERIQH